MARPITQDRVKITVDHPSGAFSGPWDTVTGGGLERENVKMRPGAGEAKLVMHTQPEYADFTVTRLFDPDRDAALLANLNSGEAYPGTTVTLQYLDADLNAIPGAKTVHTGCVVASVEPPEGDANSSDAAKLSVTFTRVGAQ